MTKMKSDNLTDQEYQKISEFYKMELNMKIIDKVMAVAELGETQLESFLLVYILGKMH